MGAVYDPGGIIRNSILSGDVSDETLGLLTMYDYPSRFLTTLLPNRDIGEE